MTGCTAVHLVHQADFFVQLRVAYVKFRPPVRFILDHGDLGERFGAFAG